MRYDAFNASRKRLEAAFGNYLPRGQYAQFDTSLFTRMDESEQLAFDVDAIAAGILTLDEVRARRGLDPAPTTPEVEANV